MIIDVFQDTVCPWCRIGKKHLKLALEQWTQTNSEPITLNYRTFFLNPSIPSEGAPFREYMLAKGGGRIALEDFFEGPRRAGAAVGLTFNFEQITRAPNSLRSHTLIAIAPEPLKEEVIDALYAAYFEFGRDIGDEAVLLEIAEACGLDRDAAAVAIHDPALHQQLLGEADQAHALGITGVPFFVFDNTFAMSGAQPPQVFLRALDQVVQFRVK
ncbi:MAG: DsbA family protein [Anaerolineae bacterium]